MTDYLEADLSYNAVIRSVRYDPDGSNPTEGLTLAADVDLTLVENQVGFDMGADGAVPTDILQGDVMTFESTDYGTVSFDLSHDNSITLMQVTQPDGSISDVMTITHYHVANGTTTGYDILYLQVSGAELPAFTSLAALDAWDADAEWTVSPRYTEGTAVIWSIFDNDPPIYGTDYVDFYVNGTSGDDLIYAGDGGDWAFGRFGDDTIYGGGGHDQIFGDLGGDHLYGDHGNDQLLGVGGNDVLEGGAGSDTLWGCEGDDTLFGSELSDVLQGCPGDDYLDGGLGFDRLNGGSGADRFYHTGVAGDGTDWVADCRSAEGDSLVFGIATATRDQFQVNWANTARAGAAGVQEAFVVYRPTGQIIWALVDGAAQDHIWLHAGENSYDLLA